MGLGIVRGQQLSGTLGIVCEQLLSKAGRGWGLRISWYGVCYQGVVVAVELYDMMLVAVWFGLVCKLPLAFLEASPASCLPPPPGTSLVWFERTTDAGFTRRSIVTDVVFASLTLNDVDRDGNLDAVVVSGSGSDAVVVWFRWGKRDSFRCLRVHPSSQVSGACPSSWVDVTYMYCSYRWLPPPSTTVHCVCATFVCVL